MGHRVGVDIGGTFIDFCTWDEETEALHSLKVLTTPATPGAELLRGLKLLEERHGIAPGAITSFVHGTTVGINTVIQRKGADLALITTRQFEDVIELARLRMPEAYSLFSRRGAPLVHTLPGRMGWEIRLTVQGGLRILEKIERVEPYFKPDGTACCPVHKMPLLQGRFGLYCSAKAKPGEAQNEKGYCSLKFVD